MILFMMTMFWFRCKDPTDLGSYASAIKCTLCMKKKVASVGYILSSSTNPDLWQCSQCQARFTTVNIQNLVFRIHESWRRSLTTPALGSTRWRTSSESTGT